MTVAVNCPKCDELIDAPNDGEPVRCPRCEILFSLKTKGTYSEGIQTLSTPTTASAPRQSTATLEDEPPRHGTPRSPFPWSAILVVLVGILFFLLIFSVGFNIWFIVQPERCFFNGAARRAEQQANQQRMIAEQAAQQARALQVEAERRQAMQLAELQELQRQLEAVRAELKQRPKGVEPPGKGVVK